MVTNLLRLRTRHRIIRLPIFSYQTTFKPYNNNDTDDDDDNINIRLPHSSPTVRTGCLHSRSHLVVCTLMKWSESPRVCSTPVSLRQHPKNFGVVISVVTLLGKPAISLKRGKIGPRLLLMNYRKLHMCFRLVPKSTTLDDREGPLCTLFQNMCLFRSPPRKFEWR